MSTAPDNKTLLFLHIGRTAGTTIHRILEREYAGSSYLTIDEMVHGQSSRHQLAQLCLEEREGLVLVKGHFAFGIHHELPNDTEYFTFLRNPIDRVISGYNQIFAESNNALHDEVTSGAMTFEDYLATGLTNDFDNGQTRALAGIRDVPIGECSEEMLDRAKRNVHSHFGFVGIADCFDASLLIMQKMYGWKTPFYLKRNKLIRKQVTRDTIDPNTLAFLEQANRLDSALYRWIKDELFPRWLSRYKVTSKKVTRYRTLRYLGVPYAAAWDLKSAVAKRTRARFPARS